MTEYLRGDLKGREEEDSENGREDNGLKSHIWGTWVCVGGVARLVTLQSYVFRD